MPWDTPVKAAGDRVLSDDWNDMVAYVKALNVDDIEAALGKIGVDLYPISPDSYQVFKVGSAYYMRKGVDGTVAAYASADAAMQAGVAAGGKHFYLSSGVVWTLTGSLVPAGITVEGEDMNNVELKTPTPAGDILYIGARSMIANLKVTDASTNGKAAGVTARVHYFINGRDTTSVSFSAHPDQALLVATGESGVDKPGIGVNNYGDGDNYWAGVIGGSDGIGFNCFVNQGYPAGYGKGVAVKIWDTGHGAVLESGSGATGKLLRLQTDAGTGAALNMIYLNPSVNLTDVILLTTGALTTGRMINLYHGTSAFSGYGLLMNFGGDAGSFSGQFLRCEKNGTVKFAVYDEGAVYAGVDGIATKVKAGAVGDGDFSMNQNGKIAVDSTNGRIYFRYLDGWHYVNQTAGFEIPANEVNCPLCGKPIEIGQEVKQVMDSRLSDGALHGHYEHQVCLSQEKKKGLLDRIFRKSPSSEE